jgi:hypothetical protein
MPPPTSQLTPPFSNPGTGYKPPDFFGDRFKLKLDLPFLPSQLGWAAQLRNGQVLNLGYTLPGFPDVSDSFWNACAAVARCQSGRSSLDPTLLSQTFSTAANDSLWDTLYGLLRGAGPGLWPDVPGDRTNVVTKKPVSQGKIDPSGKVVPTAPDGVVAGTAIPSPAISLGKRFLFASHPDIHLYLYLDKDAYADQPKYLLGGGAVGLEGKTSGGTPLKLRFGAGRDAAGGGAGFITIQIGPDYVQMPPNAGTR